MHADLKSTRGNQPWPQFQNGIRERSVWLDWHRFVSLLSNTIISSIQFCDTSNVSDSILECRSSHVDLEADFFGGRGSGVGGRGTMVAVTGRWSGSVVVLKPIVNKS